MKTLKVDSHFLALKDICYYINGHFFGEDKRDITIVLDRDDALEFIKTVNSDSYEEVTIGTEGEYFYATSSIEGSYLIIESVKAQNGVVNAHEGDILILPHYVPQEVRKACVDGSAVVIELALESIYEKLVELIEG